ncbi:hypothetical protein HJFPF1_09916 [Paramyrothecium foliicola]|nr:hypothetical protein HJFPF1_09916 [Paramyrothecium foliicola]
MSLIPYPIILPGDCEAVSAQPHIQNSQNPIRDENPHNQICHRSHSIITSLVRFIHHSLTKMARQSDAEVQSQFSSLYLQHVTKELAEDLDKVRTADDFKADSISFLVHALQQGATQFSIADQRRAVSGSEGEEKGGSKS